MSKKMNPSKWTNGGEHVLIVRCMTKDRKTHNGFKNPTTLGETVTAPDWNPEPKCGGGIHGWPWGLSLGDGKECLWDGLWQVYAVAPDDVVGGEVDLLGKCKFRTGKLVFQGEWWEATNYVLSGRIKFVEANARGSASATGERGSASATGESGSAAASEHALCAVVTGLSGRAKACAFGCIALAWLNRSANRVEMRCSVIGDGGLEPDTWYRLDENGKFIRAERSRSRDRNRNHR